MPKILVKLLKIAAWTLAGMVALGFVLEAVGWEPPPKAKEADVPVEKPDAAPVPVATAPAATPPQEQPKVEAPKVEPTPEEEKEAEEAPQRTVIIDGQEFYAPNLNPTEKAEALAVLSGLKKLHGECLSMPRDPSLPSGRQCGDLMRQNQPRAKAFRARTESMPTQLTLSLGVAAIEMGLGCSCLKSAPEYLLRAGKGLDEAAIYLKD